MDAHGWANVDALLAGIGRKYAIDRGVLEEIVRTDGKQRYSFNADRTMIRANQGHSIPVDVELSTAEPPETLFHGTAERFAASIEAQGLRPKSRLYVHLSSNAETAEAVGRRHGAVSYTHLDVYKRQDRGNHPIGPRIADWRPQREDHGGVPCGH